MPNSRLRLPLTLQRTERRPGSKWRGAARSLTGSHISSMIFPAPELTSAAIYQGGIMMSRDGGKTWERRDNGVLHNDMHSLGATTLNGRLRLFAGTESAHFYISDDLGANWRESLSLRSSAGVVRWTFPGPPHQAHVKVITVAPDDPATVYASIEQGDLLRSTDGGEMWQELSGFGGYPDQLTYLPSRPEVFLASGARGNPFTWMQTGFAGSRIALSRAGGRPWGI